nr:MAG TPA: hypothetical protein [Caudoviricetes sp.]
MRSKALSLYDWTSIPERIFKALISKINYILRKMSVFSYNLD